MSQPKKTSSKSKTTKKTAAPATSKKVATRAVSAKSVALKPVVDTLPEVKVELPVVAEVEMVETQLVETQLDAAMVAAITEPVAPTREVSRAEFMEMVRKEAYRRAAMRNFRNGSPFQDWVNAEAAVSGKLAAEGARLS